MTEPLRVRIARAWLHFRRPARQADLTVFQYAESQRLIRDYCNAVIRQANPHKTDRAAIVALDVLAMLAGVPT